MNAGRSLTAIGSFRRRGLSTPALLMSLMVALLFVVLAVNLAQLSLQRRQMQQGIDAGSLAAAAELQFLGWLYLGPRGNEPSPSQIEALILAANQQQQAAAREAALTFAGLNDVAGQPVTIADEDIVFGWVEEPADRTTPMSQRADGICNAVGIRAVRSKAGNNPPVLWLAKNSGLEHVDVVVSTQAVIDDRIVGFRPLAHVNVPLAPLAILPTLEDRHIDDTNPNLPEFIWWARGEADNYTVDTRTNEVSPGGEGIAEIEIRVHGAGGPPAPEDGEIRTGVLASFEANPPSPEAFEQFAVLGFNLQNLESFGGEIKTTDDDPLLLDAQFDFSSSDLNHIREGLMRIEGQPRIWPIGADVSTVLGRPGVGVVGFVAGSLVECRVDGNDLVVVVQPCVLQTPTALTDASALRNPWIGKLLLNR